MFYVNEKTSEKNGDEFLRVVAGHRMTDHKRNEDIKEL
jgi:hypothetical protein